MAPAPVKGLSSLGVGNEPADAKSVSYLLEDEESPSHRGRNLILILLIAAVAAAAWHWRQDLRAVVDRFLSRPAPAANSDNQEPNSSATASTDSPSGATPANSASAGSPIQKPATGTTDQTSDQAPAQTPPVGAPPAAGAADSTQSPAADQSPTSNPSPGSDSAATKTDDSGETAPEPAPARKSPKMRTPPAAASRTEDLEAEGEKYLYGNGVPENCTRARTNLLAAAQHSNAQAQNVLGTMYATGHCATRDLPTAYRWFSRSLRKDPSNARIEQDLKVLWNQMTPEERQLALRDTH